MLQSIMKTVFFSNGKLQMLEVDHVVYKRLRTTGKRYMGKPFKRNTDLCS